VAIQTSAMQQQRGSRRGEEEAATTTDVALVQTFRVIEDLQSVGINASDIKKLQEAGLSTIGQVLQTCGRDLVAIKGFSCLSFLKSCTASFRIL
jgi:Trk K+ transport system NAD-binding subunit